ncbi:MAG: hypothetical protein UX38_C0003G0030 [Microgenomates group bacterium GW2011_GWC1_46_16]|uniref:Uncharacterized protein n=2 Tax=Candidatus Collieribacteriota TaxID=1752725 RepID=A0A1F5FYQ6_9BACT|nr:MAG: hypothetical protein UX32_C0002G0035 [Microgenomates group bacterium GW2011_GWF1_46_12]KKU26765.1 MAG: hypothetical protein UX38_C0003G0030 [Microgenomates group bacterium GW2011_GWC1_46_16]KKU27999.1 MAG: hypothetical protein UX40_C0004G0029 [Microgenomates group bacterium GW2011_GWF2_46_18]KKU44234.1 MAG: hypothetical protein UX59_C0002G0020 [Microgenomates group bacterium GW2011_GWA1_46_7]KKU45673.1 MAG: hypothetical protein UX63_C0002G0034 [Microgenomates group bacterium GW2011_GWB1
MKRYVLSHVPMAVVYGLLVFVVRAEWSNLEWANIFPWGGWVVGVIIGVLVLFLDRVVYTYSYPGAQISQQFAWYIQQRKYGSALSLLDVRRMEQERLTFRSALFMAIWVPLAFFALTSTGGLFGKGVVMGLMLHILMDAWRLQRTEPRRLHVRLFWLIKREILDEERLVFLWVMTGIFGLFSFWVR